MTTFCPQTAVCDAILEGCYFKPLTQDQLDAVRIELLDAFDQNVIGLCDLIALDIAAHISHAAANGGKFDDLPEGLDYNRFGLAIHDQRERGLLDFETASILLEELDDRLAQHWVSIYQGDIIGLGDTPEQAREDGSAVSSENVALYPCTQELANALCDHFDQPYTIIDGVATLKPSND